MPPPRMCHLPESFIIPLQACLKGSTSLPDSSGESCGIGDALKAGLSSITGSNKPESNDDDDTVGSRYAAAIRENILASGDVCSRAIMMGSILGLVGDGSPESFLQQFHVPQAEQVKAAAATIATKHEGK